jgi:hypothetical protein
MAMSSGPFSLFKAIVLYQLLLGFTAGFCVLRGGQPSQPTFAR